jgi:hypothetical protein
MRTISTVLFTLFTSTAFAQSWEFDQPVAVTQVGGKGIFHHLESSGRQNIAISDGVIGIAWEDNRSGKPQIYLARMHPGKNQFSEVTVSNGNEAYEPVIRSLGESRFFLAWEQDGNLFYTTAEPNRLIKPVLLRKNARTVSLVVDATGSVHTVWVERQDSVNRVVYTSADLTGSGDVRWTKPVAITPGKLLENQNYPGIVATGKNIVVTWEDRKHGHTRIYTARLGSAGVFGEPQQLNQTGKRRSLIFGKGSGVMRPVLSAVGKEKISAIWMDKRNFQTGYDVFGSFSTDGGKSFGPNIQVQDQFGNAVGQWHGALAAHPTGLSVAAWDDDRDESRDIWISSNTGNSAWSEDFTSEIFSGEGEQTDPAIVLGRDGDIHLVWLERKDSRSTTKIWYTFGKRQP